MNGDEIKAAREERGWTQLQLAREVGVSVSTVSNWERGETVPKNRMGMLRRVLAAETVSTPSESDPSELRYRRPEGISDQQWERIRTRGQAYIEGLIDSAAEER